VGLLTGSLAYGLLKKKVLVLSFFLSLLFCIGAVGWLQKENRYLHYAPNFNKTIFHTDFKEHLVATYQLEDMSTAERFYRWVAGVRMAKKSWKTGFGPNTFYNNYRGYTIPLFKTWVSRNDEHSTVHNYFLLLLVEQGVTGLLLFLILLAVAFHTAQRLYHRTANPFWKGALACVAVVLVMVCTVNFLSDLIETDNTGPVFYLCLAVLILAEKSIKREASELASHV
jgi:O-antigen ligase